MNRFSTISLAAAALASALAAQSYRASVRA